MRRSIARALGVAGAATAIVAAAIPASAAPYYYNGYGNLAHEKVYPTGNHACGGSGWRQAVSARSAKYHGRTYTIRLCYNGSYGAYARLDGAAVNDKNCWIVLDRSKKANDTKSVPASVAETVDSGVGYAYTKVGNDLHGRLARAALVCGNGTVPVRTSWY